ncbi:MAG: SDR family oxidoreductase [Candidatus Odinarchaeota archaeon]
MSMKGETAIITGSTSGIGKKIAELFLREGCKVMICSRNENNVKETVAGFQKEFGDSVVGFPCDVSKVEDLKNIVDKTLELFGSVRILVANAGLNLTYGPFRYIPTEEIASDSQVVTGANLIGMMNSVAAVLPHMINQGYGRIITLAGAGAGRPMPYMTIYSATKGGVLSFSKCFAEELKEMDSDIKINIFFPGMIETNLAKNSKIPAGWKKEEELRKESALAHKYLGADIEKSCSKVIPYALPTCKDNGKSFRGFSIVKMIRGGRKLQKAMKESK